MAPKNSLPLEDPSAALSTEDEEVSSSEASSEASSEEETDLDEEKKENLTEDGEDDDKEEPDDVPMKESEKAKSNRNSGTESESSESENFKPKKVSLATKPVLRNPSKPGVVGSPSKSAAKRPALKTEHKGKETKRAKTTEHGKKQAKTTEHEHKETKRAKTEHGKKQAKTIEEPDEKDNGERAGTVTVKKPLFQRLFTNDDEIALLQGMIDFIENTGDPYDFMDDFCKFIKNSLSCKASRAQVVDKLRRLNKKYDKGVDKVYLNAHDQKAFDMWKKIWGKEGALHKEGKKKEKERNLRGNKVEIMHCTNTVVSGKDVALLFKKTNMAGLDETVVVQGWNNMDDTMKKQLEEKLKKLQVAEMEVFMQRIELTGEICKEISRYIKACHATV